MRKFEGFEHGINLGGWLSQCEHGKMHYDTFITEKDIEKIASWKVDHVRLPIDYEALKSGLGYLYIDKCVEWCLKYGLHIILDMHSAPGYSFDDYEAAEFFDSEELQAEFVAVWTELAKRYGGNSEVIAFELLNEVVDDSVSRCWNDIIARTLAAIRSYAPAVKVIIGGTCYSNIYTLKELENFEDTNIVYTFHCYDPFVFTHQAAHWVSTMTPDYHISYPRVIMAYYEEALRISKRNARVYEDMQLYKNIDKDFFKSLFSVAMEVAKERDMMLYCGEYGTIDQADCDSTLSWMQDISAAFDECGIGRALWNYKEKDFGLEGAHYAPILSEMIKYL